MSAPRGRLDLPHRLGCPVLRGADPDRCACDHDPVDLASPHQRHPRRNHTMDAELDGDTAATLAKLADVQAQIKALTDDAELYKAQLRDRLAAGAYTVGGRPAVSITPTRRFDAARAEEALPVEWRSAVQRWVVDPALAKQVLPPALYQACQVESGKPTVKLA